MPAVQLGVQRHAEPATATPGPLLVDACNVSTHSGWSIDEADIFRHVGQVIAQARQLRRVLGPVTLHTGRTDGRQLATTDSAGEPR